MTDDAQISYYGIGYDLNILGTDFENGHKLKVNIGISSTTTNICKGIYKTVLTEKQTEINNKSDNHLDIHSSNAIIELPRKLVLKVMTDLTPKPANPCILDTLLPNSNFRAICDHIYLLFLLNQLQYLIIKRILDHTIKFKGKMFLNSGK